jgi:lambda family phage portal protein
MANKLGRYIDSAIGVLSPGAGLKRSANRARMNLMNEQNRRYEGAQDGRRANSWIGGTNASVNLMVGKDLKNLVSRSRELAINNSYAKKAPWIIANNIVGMGILLTPTIPDVVKEGKIKKFPKADNWLKVVAAAWKEWADELYADYNGDFNFYGLQHLVIRTKVVSGEVLAVRRRVPVAVNKYGFQILILEGDYIDTSKDTGIIAGPNGYTYKGVKFDKDHKRVGIWLWDAHPSEGAYKSTFYEMKDIIHFYEVERTGQMRGVPDSSASMTTQRDFADYMDAELLQKKGAACFSAIVQKNELPETDTTQQGEQLEELQPGAIQYLQPGETIHFPDLPQNPGLESFVKVQLRAIAAGYLMPYENLTGDLSNVTFISGRLGQLDFKKQVEYWQQTSFIPKFCERVFQWFIESAKIAVGLPEDITVKGKWTAPRWQMMDPTKEILAMKEEVRAGFASWEEKVREMGGDPKEVLEEMITNQKDFIAAGLMPSSNPYFELQAKVTMNQGKPQATPKE